MRINYTNGYYEGEVNAAGKAHGYGKTTYNSGAWYEGYYNNGKRSGYGKYTFSSGTYYVGCFYEGNYHGFGREYYTNGDWREGFYLNDKKIGWHVYHYSNGNWILQNCFGDEVIELLRETDVAKAIVPGHAGRKTLDDGTFVGDVVQEYNGRLVARGYGLFGANDGSYSVTGQFDDNEQCGYALIELSDGRKIYCQGIGDNYCRYKLIVSDVCVFWGETDNRFIPNGAAMSFYTSNKTCYTSCHYKNGLIDDVAHMLFVDGRYCVSDFKDGKFVRIHH